MRFLIEAHHPAHIHFWKYPIRELIEKGHNVQLIGRDRDVMKELLEVYDWIPAIIPPRASVRNRFPLKEMLKRQFVVAKEILRFKPDVVASLMGSYCQSARLLGCRNIIFTDTETQALNHRIANPFAHEIHTPLCFLKDLGSKQIRYSGIHELAFLDGRRFTPDETVLEKYDGLEAGRYLLIRLSAWNTLHDIKRRGLGEAVYRFVDRFRDDYKIVISAEEDKIPPGLESYTIRFAPEDFHQLVAQARFVLTEGASTASEAACLGVPSVFINSVGALGNFELLGRDYPLVRVYQGPEKGIPSAISWLENLAAGNDQGFSVAYAKFVESHENVCEYIVRVMLQNSQFHGDEGQ